MLDPKTVVPVDARGKVSGKLQPGKDVKVRLLFDAPFEPAVLRVRLHHLSGDGQVPVESVAEVLTDAEAPGEVP